MGLPEEVAGQKITEPEVKNLFSLWNDALATLDPDAVTARYSKNALLLPTVSDTPRDSAALIKDYFVGFLKKQPQGKILESNVQIGNNWCQDAGSMNLLWVLMVLKQRLDTLMFTYMKM